MKTKIILKNIWVGFLACYLFWATVLGWDYMLHAINPHFAKGYLMTFGPIEFAGWLAMGTLVIFAPFTFATLLIFLLGFVSSRNKSPKESIQLEDEKKPDRNKAKTKKIILFINIFLPYALCMVLFVINLPKDFFDWSSINNIEEFFETAIFMIPLYLMSGIIYTIILHLFSHIDIRVLNLRFVLLFVLCFSILTFIIKPFWFESIVFFLIFLSIIVGALNFSKIILRKV